MIHESLLSLLEFIKEPVIVRNLKGSVILANSGAREFYGSGDELPGAIMPEEETERFQEILLQKPQSNESRRIVGIRIKQNGEPIEMELNVIPVCTDDGKALGAVEVVSRQEQDLNRLGASALAMAAAHDLRSPLSILNNILLLMQHKVEDKHLEMIRKQLLICESIVDNFLEFSSRRSPRTRTVDLNSLISETLSILPAPSGINLTFQEDANISISVDPGQIRQVVLNLVQNAIEALHGKGGNIWIRLSEKDHFVHLDITDTGPGIAPQHLPRMFQPFFSTKDRGFGLGLASCKQITQAHGGTIEVRSERGAGTTFSVRIPCIK